MLLKKKKIFSYGSHRISHYTVQHDETEHQVKSTTTASQQTDCSSSSKGLLDVYSTTKIHIQAAATISL